MFEKKIKIVKILTKKVWAVDKKLEMLESEEEPYRVTLKEEEAEELEEASSEEGAEAMVEAAVMEEVAVAARLGGITRGRNQATGPNLVRGATTK